MCALYMKNITTFCKESGKGRALTAVFFKQKRNDKWSREVWEGRYSVWLVQHPRVRCVYLH